MSRDAAFDHIRIVLIGLVIFHHTAIVYGGSGGWYWRELPNASNPVLVAFNAINQSFFMGVFFLLAGYFTTMSFERKGAKVFLADRFLRLGLPLVIYFFVISPFTIALAATSRGIPFLSGWKKMILLCEFEPGPLWFVESLLIFSLVYVLWKKLQRSHATTPGPTALPGFSKLAITTILLGLISFAVRLYVPVGQSVLWLQLGYFPCYVFLYAAGCASYHFRILENVTLRQAIPWMLLSIITVVSLPIVIVKRIGAGAFEGGYNLNALFYALWDPFTAWGIILGMLWFFRKFLYRSNGITRFLARRVYTIYIIHPPVLVLLSLLLSNWAANPMAKFFTTGVFTFLGCVAISSLVLLPPVRRVL